MHNDMRKLIDENCYERAGVLALVSIAESLQELSKVIVTDGSYSQFHVFAQTDEVGH